MLEPFIVPSAAMAPALLPGDQVFIVKAGPAAKANAGDIVIYPEPDSRTSDGAFAGSMTHMFNNARAKTTRPPLTFIKRLVAVGGDTVEGDGKEVRITGVPLKLGACTDPEYTYTDSMPGERDARVASAECAVETARSGKEYRVIFDPKGEGNRRPFGPTSLESQEAFVMGDNRDHSMDSRFTGPIDTESITGRAVVIWFSFSWADGIRWNRIGTRL